MVTKNFFLFESVINEEDSTRRFYTLHLCTQKKRHPGSLVRLFPFPYSVLSLRYVVGVVTCNTELDPTFHWYVEVKFVSTL